MTNKSQACLCAKPIPAATRKQNGIFNVVTGSRKRCGCVSRYYYRSEGKDIPLPVKMGCTLSTLKASVDRVVASQKAIEFYSLSDLWNECLNDDQWHGYSKDTRKQYTSGWNNYIAPFLGDMRPRDIDAPLYSELQSKFRRGKVELGSRVVEGSFDKSKLIRNVMSFIVGIGQEKGHWDSNIVHAVRPPKRTQEEKAAKKERNGYMPPHHQYQKVFDAAPTPLKISMELQLLLSIRIGQVSQMDMTMVTEHGIDITLLKNGRKHVKLWNDRLRAVFEAREAWLEELGLEDSEDAPVLPDENGAPFDTGKMIKMMKAVQEHLLGQGKITRRWTPHTVKKISVTEWRKKLPKEAIAEIVGQGVKCQEDIYNLNVDIVPALDTDYGMRGKPEAPVAAGSALSV